jgi:hypothetical protein
VDDSSMDDSSTDGSAIGNSTITPEEQLNKIYLIVLKNSVLKGLFDFSTLISAIEFSMEGPF